MRQRCFVYLAIAAVVLGGCTRDDNTAGEVSADQAATTDGETEFGDSSDTDAALAELDAAGFCDPEDVSGTGDVGEVTSMSFIVDGTQADPCFGQPDDRLDRAWESLVAIAPAEYVNDVDLLAGYEACEGCDILAFVSTLDQDGTFFLMAVDVTAEQDDPDGLLLTLLHELSHVVTQQPVEQLGYDVSGEDCDTYHNGSGCFTDGSYMWDWIRAFWAPDDLAGLVDGDPDEAAGAARCEIGGAYTGPYGASSPEEDFAEVFSAFVFDVDVDEALAEKLAFFGTRPEFDRLHVQADELGLSGLPGDFEGCG